MSVQAYARITYITNKYKKIKIRKRTDTYPKLYQKLKCLTFAKNNH